MTEDQKHLYKLFKEIVEICDKHNIVYYMAGGTLIGAIRHKGFIPWDDDMDIMMTRDNWLKFIEVSKNELPENRVLKCQELDRNYSNTFGRYCDTSTATIHKSEITSTEPSGYIVDILTLDPLPDDKLAYDEYVADLMLYSDLIVDTASYSYRYSVNEDRLPEYMNRIDSEGRDKVLSEIEARMFRYNEDECSKLVLRWGGVPFLFDKDMYGSSRWADFEDIRCRIPDRTNDYLVQHYGDEWSYIPPHGEHETHEAVFSLNMDCETIRNDYMRFIDVDSYHKNLREKKLFLMREMKERQYYINLTANMIAEAARLELEKKIERTGIDLEMELERENYSLLNDFFAEYYAAQNGRGISGREDFPGAYKFYNPVYVDIDDSVFYIAIMMLINTNKMSKAMRFMEIREKIKGSLDENLIKARNLVLEIRKAVSAYDLGRKDEAFALASGLFEKNKKNESLNMFMVRLLVERGEYESARKIIDKKLEDNPNDGYYIKYLGDYYLNVENNREKASKCYEKACQTTTNGMVLLEISEFMS